MGELLDMIQARDEELQTSWACSAQNPDMLPRRPTAKQTKQSVKSAMERMYFS